jgi:hypothetical protein
MPRAFASRSALKPLHVPAGLVRISNPVPNQQSGRFLFTEQKNPRISSIADMHQSPYVPEGFVQVLTQD